MSVIIATMTKPAASPIDAQSTPNNGHGEVKINAPSTVSLSTAVSHDALPHLLRDVSFWGMATTQFLGAFNDSLFKQLVLLLATPTKAQMAAGIEDRQGQAQLIFAAAFLIFSGFAGYVSDRYSKRRVVLCAKVAEIGIMFFGFLGFWWYGLVGLNGLMLVLFMMGVHSAFFGPAKYGILPELIRPIDLPRANGLFLMLTFLAIIFGTGLASVLLGSENQRMWLGSLVCMGIAAFGTLTALIVRPVPAAQPNLEHSFAAWGVPKDIRDLLRRDHQLLWAILVVAVFWMVGGIVLPAVNALGKTQFGLAGWRLGVLTASMGVGIAVGCVLGGYLSRGRVNRTVVIGGALGAVITLLLMALPGTQQGHLLGYYGSIPVLILVGMFSGMFIVPVQVALQSRPPKEEKGRMIATMNQCSWVGIILGAVLWEICQMVLAQTGWPPSLIFAVTAALMLPVALFYRPKDEKLADH
jgi:acyl-[acyl-carrier-protein]-phospholipid O-acyltransferase/long-chain-fatty-acid--[acyl-carrier-protein] ligase